MMNFRESYTITVKSFSELSTIELYHIYYLRTKVFVVEQNCPYQEVDEKDLQAFHLSVYSKRNNELAAYLRILPKGVSYNEVSIGRVVVAAKYRRKGVADAMMKEALVFIQKVLGETDVRISAQTYLKDFYESLGFVKQKEEYLEDGIPHIEMLLTN